MSNIISKINRLPNSTLSSEKKIESFNKKLKAYSLLISSVFASVAVADAQMVYTDINPDEHGEFYLDLNNDGLNEYMINYVEYDNSDGVGYTNYELILK